MNSLPEKSVDLIFADPPYNLQLSQDLFRPNSTLVDAVDDEWDQFESFEQYDAFTRSWLTAARRVLSDNGGIWVIGTYHNIFRVGAIMMDLGFWMLNDIVWLKPNPLPQLRGTRFCNAHETLIWAKKSKKSKYTFHYRQLKSGSEDKQMRSDWVYPLCQGNERRSLNGEKAHATQKPESLLHRVIVSTSNPGDLVLDPFCGSGTTAAVAKKLGRRFITIDREIDYVNVAKTRIDEINEPMLDLSEVFEVDRPRPKIPFITFVELGIIPVGTKLRFLSRDEYATVNADGTITWNGIKGSIHKIACQCMKSESVNGWIKWQMKNEQTGKYEAIDLLRERALKKEFEGINVS
jgi:DNA modification methylase